MPMLLYEMGVKGWQLWKDINFFAQKHVCLLAHGFVNHKQLFWGTSFKHIKIVQTSGAKASWTIPTFCLQNDSSVTLFLFHVNISLLAEQLQQFPCRTIPVNHWNRFASVSLFWFCFTNWLIFRSTIDLVLSLVYTILRQYQQNDNSNLLAERFQYFTGIILQVNCCYRFIDMSWKQRNTGIILQAKSWNYSTCFGP